MNNAGAVLPHKKYPNDARRSRQLSPYYSQRHTLISDECEITTYEY